MEINIIKLLQKPEIATESPCEGTKLTWIQKVNIKVDNTIKLKSEFLLPDKDVSEVVGERGATWKKRKRKKVNIQFNFK